MKKKLTLSLILTLVFSIMFAGCANLSMLTNSVGEVQYIIVDDHAEVIALPNGSDDTDIVIDDTYEGKPVTVIKDYIGCNLEAAETIHIGKNISQIGVWSFSNNQALKQYDVDPQNESFCSVDGAIYTKDMKTLCYYPCNGGNSYTMPNTVETIGARAFYKNGTIQSITLSTGLKEIKEMAFFQCTAMNDFNLPEGLQFIGKDAFTKCTGVTEISIPSSIEEIKEYAFYNCENLTSVTVNKAEKDIKLGSKWYPTKNGNKIDELNINWK